MPITYVRLVHSKPDPFPFRRPIEDTAPTNIVLIFDPVAEANVRNSPRAAAESYMHPTHLYFPRSMAKMGDRTVADGIEIVAIASLLWG
jgi:hypothetical protein